MAADAPMYPLTIMAGGPILKVPSPDSLRHFDFFNSVYMVLEIRLAVSARVGAS